MCVCVCFVKVYVCASLPVSHAFHGYEKPSAPRSLAPFSLARGEEALEVDHIRRLLGEEVLLIDGNDTHTHTHTHTHTQNVGTTSGETLKSEVT